MFIITSLFFSVSKLNISSINKLLSFRSDYYFYNRRTIFWEFFKISSIFHNVSLHSKLCTYTETTRGLKVRAKKKKNGDLYIAWDEFEIVGRHLKILHPVARLIIFVFYRSAKRNNWKNWHNEIPKIKLYNRVKFISLQVY
jgi:hypothetical protein